MCGRTKTLGQTKVVIELPPSLRRFADPKTKGSWIFKKYLLGYLNGLVADLTIPLKILLMVRLGDNKGRFTMNSFEVTIDGRKCRLPLPIIVSQDIEVLELTRTITEVIIQNRELLVTVPLAEKIRDKWSSEQGELYLPGLSGEEFHKFLSLLVHRGFRVDPGKEIGQAFKEKGQSKWGAAECFEEAVSGLNTTALVLFLKDEEIEKQWATDDHPIEEWFDLMQDGLFYEIGLHIPKVRRATDNSLKRDEFRIQLNDVRFPAIPGLKPDEFLVNDTFDRLPLLKLSGRKAINPANGSECAIIQGGHSALEVCQKAGLTHWGPAGFIILQLASAVRRNAGSLLTTETVEYSIHRLHPDSPALIDATSKSFDIITLTRVLRGLLEEGLSIRDLRGILEALLLVNCSVDEGQSKNTAFLPHALDALRITLNRNIWDKYTKSGDTLSCYLLSPDIEREINNIDKQLLEDEERNLLIKAIFDEVGDFTRVGQIPVILTTIEARGKLRSVIDKEFPQLAVLCYQEVSPDKTIRTISRISWK